MSAAALRSSLEQLLYEYAEVLDDGDLSTWPMKFVEQGQYRLIPRENHDRRFPVALIACLNRAMMEDRIIAIQRASVFTPHRCRHLYANLRVEETSGEQARLRANYSLYRSTEDGETTLLSVGRVLATVALGSTPLFEQMDVVYDTFRIPGLVVFPI